MTKDTETKWGCAAVGRSGGVNIDADEGHSGLERWAMSIEHPHLFLRFKIAGPQVLGQLLAFLQHHWNQSSHGELALGTIDNVNISVIKDNEFVDRFFLCAASDDGAVRYTLSSDEIKDYVVALKSAIDDLNNDT